VKKPFNLVFTTIDVVNGHESSGRFDRKIDPAYFMITMLPFLFSEGQENKKNAQTKNILLF
jgi:hypothetical protein